MKKAVFGIVENAELAQQIVENLHAHGFDYEAISILFADKGELKTSKFQGSVKKRGILIHEKKTKSAEGSAAGATAGGIIGGTIGLLAGLGTISIPGLGLFIAAGPIMGALSGSAVGGSAGLLAGYLIGLNIPEYVVKGYEGSLRAGNVLISVHCENEKEVEAAIRTLKTEGADDISTTLEKAISQ